MNRVAETKLAGQRDEPFGPLGDDTATRYEVKGRQSQFDGFDAMSAKLRTSAARLSNPPSAETELKPAAMMLPICISEDGAATNSAGMPGRSGSL